MKRIHTALLISLLTSLTFILNAFDGTAISYFYRDYGNNNRGVWLYDMSADTFSQVYKAAAGNTIIQNRPLFSPDGKKIAWINGADELIIVNNDGSDAQVVRTNCGIRADSFGWSWNLAGIWWVGAFPDTPDSAVYLYRFDPITKTATIAFDFAKDQDTGAVGTFAKIKGGHYFASHDGTKAWCRVGIMDSSFYHPDAPYKSVDWAHIIMQWSPDFSSVTLGFETMWGHGEGIQLDGEFILLNNGYGDASRGQTWRYPDGKRDELLARNKGHLCWAQVRHSTVHSEVQIENYLVPPTVRNATDGHIHAPILCFNDTQWLVYKNDGDTVYYAWNTATDELQTIRMRYFDRGYYCSGFWKGPLPAPTNEPLIALDKSSLVFQLDASGTAGAQQLAVTNAGSGVMQTVTASSNASWLQSAVGGNDNSQTIDVSITGALPSDANTATLTITGGGASNRVAVQVAAYKAGVLAAPDNLDAQAAGDSLLDVVLTWNDNATGEQGFTIERREANGAWQEETRTGAGVVTWTDMRLDTGAYEYRVRAFGAAGAYSAYTSATTVSVEGIMWIRVTSPVSSSNAAAGSSLPITWDCNRISTVSLHYSDDLGTTWHELTGQGGVRMGDATWRNYVWDVPLSLAGKQVVIKVQEYDGTVEGLSGIIAIGDNQNVRTDMPPRTAFTHSVAIDGAILHLSRPAKNPQVRLLDFHGRMAYSSLLTDGAWPNLADGTMPRGMYLLQVLDGGIVLASKIFVLGL
ncbi:MAG: hypothetical protein GF398_15935 [Chitinivibrionales bacterium]|nr:hypothetical protein [Chitinivibrionales bacterium]